MISISQAREKAEKEWKHYFPEEARLIDEISEKSKSEAEEIVSRFRNPPTKVKTTFNLFGDTRREKEEQMMRSMGESMMTCSMLLGCAYAGKKERSDRDRWIELRIEYLVKESMK